VAAGQHYDVWHKDRRMGRVVHASRTCVRLSVRRGTDEHRQWNDFLRWRDVHDPLWWLSGTTGKHSGRTVTFHLYRRQRGLPVDAVRVAHTLGTLDETDPGIVFSAVGMEVVGSGETNGNKVDILLYAGE
jgi:hypothetical protein